MKKYFILSLMLLLFSVLGAQSENKDVTITTTGSGPTLEIAKQNALRSAIEQTYGAFISTKTEIFNDQVVADEMSSVSSGNIKSFEILSQDTLPNGELGIVIKTIVSIEKLALFTISKGFSVEIKGNLFAINIKQQILNEQAEVNAVNNLISLLHEPLQIAFDYSIKADIPQSMDANSVNWRIPVHVTANCNKNIDICAEFFINTLASISLSQSELETYSSLNKDVFNIKVKYNGNIYNFKLRRRISRDIIIALSDNWEFYVRLFNVVGIENHRWVIEENQYREKQFFNLREIDDDEYVSNFALSFPTNSQEVAKFEFFDDKTLTQIENMTGYSINPRGVVLKFKSGGYALPTDFGYDLVFAPCDYRSTNGSSDMDFNEATLSCNNLKLNGYNDWHLPTKDEFDILVEKLRELNLRGLFKSQYTSDWGFGFSRQVGYWTKSEYNSVENYVYHFDFNGDGRFGQYDKNYGHLKLRPVRMSFINELRRKQHDSLILAEEKNQKEKIKHLQETSELVKYRKYRADNPNERNKLFIFSVIERNGKIVIPILVNKSDTIYFLIGENIEATSISNEIVSTLLARKVIRKRDIRNDEVVHFDDFKFLDLPVGAPNEIPLGQDTKLKLTNSEFSILKYYKYPKLIVLTTETIERYIKRN